MREIDLRAFTSHEKRHPTFFEHKVGANEAVHTLKLRIKIVNVLLYFSEISWIRN